jgi:hypothetical protein
LLVQVIEISLKCVHLSLKPSLFLTVNHAPFFIFDLASAHLGFEF